MSTSSISSSLLDGVVIEAPSKSAFGSCERTMMSWEVQYRACGRIEKVAN